MRSDEIIDNIRILVDSYRNNYNTLNISQLLNLKDKISTYSYNLAEIASDSKMQYNVNHYINKIEFSRAKQNFMNEGNSGTKAESYATIESEESLRRKLEAESLGYKCELLLRQVNKIIDAISQRISHLRKEYERQH